MGVFLRKGTKKDLMLVERWNRGTSPEFLMQWAGPVFSYPLTAAQLSRHWGSTVEEAGPAAASVGAPEMRFYAIVEGEDAASGSTVGVVELALIDHLNRSARVARFLLANPKQRGRGIGTQVLRRLLDLCFGELGLHRVGLAVFDFNEQAIRCYERVGFRKEGLIREARRVGDEYWSYFEMGILKDEYDCGSRESRD